MLYAPPYNGRVKRLALLSIALVSALALSLVALSSGPPSVRAEITPLGPTPTPPAMSAGLASNQSSTPGLTSLGQPPNPAIQQSAVINTCTLGAEYHHWGDETLVLANFTFDLPAGGDFMVATITRPAGQQNTVEVCYRPDASVLKLHDISGGELTRTARSGEAHVAFDAIVASVRPPFNATLGIRVPTLTTVAP